MVQSPLPTKLVRKSHAYGNHGQGIIVSVITGTKYVTINSRHPWSCILKLFPEEIKPCTVTNVDSLLNEWATNTKVNDWFTFNKRTLIESELAIDEPMKLVDGA